MGHNAVKKHLGTTNFGGYSYDLYAVVCDCGTWYPVISNAFGYWEPAPRWLRGPGSEKAAKQWCRRWIQREQERREQS
jgi:hypothetical protein